MYYGQAEFQVLPSEHTSQAPPSELTSEADSKQVSDAFLLMPPSALQGTLRFTSPNFIPSMTLQNRDYFTDETEAPSGN